MIKFIRNANDTAQGTMVDLVTLDPVGDCYVWGTVHEDMLHDSYLGQSAICGIPPAYETLRGGVEVECVILTVEEFNALIGKVPA